MKKHTHKGYKASHKKHRRTTSETLAIELALNVTAFQGSDDVLLAPAAEVSKGSPAKVARSLQQSPRSSFKNNHPRGAGRRPRLKWGSTNSLTSAAAMLEDTSDSSSRNEEANKSHTDSETGTKSVSDNQNTQGIETKSQSQNLQGSKRASPSASEDEDTGKRLGRRGKYICGKCGQPKEGHICKVKVARSVEIQVDLAITGPSPEKGGLDTGQKSSVK